MIQRDSDNCGNVVKSSAAVTLSVVSEQMMMVYFMTPENVIDVFCVLNEHAQTKH